MVQCPVWLEPEPGSLPLTYHEMLVIFHAMRQALIRTLRPTRGHRRGWRLASQRQIISEAYQDIRKAVKEGDDDA